MQVSLGVLVCGTRSRMAGLEEGQGVLGQSIEACESVVRSGTTLTGLEDGRL